MSLKELKRLLISYHDWTCSLSECLYREERHPWSNFNQKQEDSKNLRDIINLINSNDDNDEEFTYEWARTIPTVCQTENFITIKKENTSDAPRIIVYKNPSQISLYNPSEKFPVNCSDISGLIKTKGDFRWFLRKMGL